jgi:hypothetical protein
MVQCGGGSKVFVSGIWSSHIFMSHLHQSIFIIYQEGYFLSLWCCPIVLVLSTTCVSLWGTWTWRLNGPFSLPLYGSQEFMVTQLQIGHTRLTLTHLLWGEASPFGNTIVNLPLYSTFWLNANLAINSAVLVKSKVHWSTSLLMTTATLPASWCLLPSLALHCWFDFFVNSKHSDAT